MSGILHRFTRRGLINRSLRTGLRWLLPARLRERLRRDWTRMTVLYSRFDLSRFCSQTLTALAVRLFDSHDYQQEVYGSAPLMSLLILCTAADCDSGALAAGLAALRQQSWADFEIMVLLADDDQQLKQKLEGQLAVLTGKNSSITGRVRAEKLSGSRLFNRAFAEARGKYVVSLRGGAQLEPTFLEKCLLLLEAAPPHFFIQCVNVSSKRFAGDCEPIDPAAALDEYRFKALVFPRTAVQILGGYDETLADEFIEWEFYVKLIRHGYVGRTLSGRIVRVPALTAAAVNCSDNRAFRRAKKRIWALHLGYIRNHERGLRRRQRQFWRVSNSLCNLGPRAEKVRQKAYWLELASGPALSAYALARLLAGVNQLTLPLIVTVDEKSRRAFFQYNQRAGLQVYQPGDYHLQKKPAYLYRYLQAFYDLEKVCPDDFPPPARRPAGRVDWPKSNKRPRKLRILFAAPWLITGGADTMVVDWFRQLDSAWCEKYLVTTLFNHNNWLTKIADYAQGVYDLPALDCFAPAAIKDFLVEFIALYQIDILHIMNSESVFQALPQLKKSFPGLKVVAQFHCFDYLADGQRAGYALSVPPRYDQFIDRYNIEYPQLGDEISTLYPAVDRNKFTVIYGRVDCGYYNPVGRRPRPEIAACQRQGVLNLLFIGRLDRQKQPLRLLEIAAQLRLRQIPFVLHVIGDGSLESQKTEFLARRQKEGLTESVIFYGEQPLECLIDWYLIADILLLTSDWEGVPMVLYQAMAMQVVPVVAAVGGCAELVTPDCGYLIREKAEARAYVEAIEELADLKHRQKLGTAGRQRMVDQFSLARLGVEYRSFYESLVWPAKR